MFISTYIIHILSTPSDSLEVVIFVASIQCVLVILAFVPTKSPILLKNANLVEPRPVFD